MLVEVRVPVLAESVAEATLMDWHKQPGDPVKFGDALIDVETDKVTLEVVAPEDGMLVKILKNSGEDVVSDELIAEIDTDGQAVAAAPEPDKKAAPIEPEPAQEPEDEPQSTAETAATDTESADDRQQSPPSEQKPKLSPAVRNLLSEHGLDAGDIPASGDRLTKKDVLDFLAGTEDKERKTGGRRQGKEDKGQEAGGEKQETDSKQQDASAVMKPAARPARQEVGTESQEAGNRVPMTRLRRRAAERLLAAQRENAILTTFNEVNMKPVMDLRSRYKDKF